MYKQGETIRLWAEDNFGAVPMSDERRVDRVVTIAEAMAVNAGKTIPQMFSRTYDVKATYELFKHDEATVENLQSGHREKVLAELSNEGVYLLVEDTTTMSWSGHDPIAGLGAIGDGKEGHQGFYVHTVLGLRWHAELICQEDQKRPPVEILGIAHQHYYVRQSKSKQEKEESSYQRKRRERESLRWAESVTAIGALAEGSRYVHIADREADIFEYLVEVQEHGHGYVVRACQDRALHNREENKRAGRLFESSRGAPELGSFRLKLRARKGHAGREADLKVSCVRVVLSAPFRPGGSAAKRAPLECSVIRVWEEATPSGVEPVEWILLTDVSAGGFERVLECVLQYATRWIIEEYHKALKTGMGAERLQLEHINRLYAAIAIKSVVALRLIDMKERVRVYEACAAEESGLTEVELDVLRETTDKPLQTVRDVALQIGRLGGHMNRKADGMPGWITLWRGMEKLRLLVEGVRLSHRLKKFG
ncbi:MAG: IS4 family transposase [Acidobacteria bacterium]|nr:IS4 family transposase [Acidobacteriota bacterium]